MIETIFDEFTNTFGAVPVSVSIVRLLAAVLLGAAIGYERERREKPAGLRTHILVSLAACLFVIVGIELTQLEFGDQANQRADPLRLIEAVTAGVAFLAAGIIFTAKGEVRNITTGASLWLSGAIGLGCGAGQIPLAAIATLMVVIVLTLIRQLEMAWGTHRSTAASRSGQDDTSG